MNIRFLLIDALNLIRRVYAAQPGDDGPGRVEDCLRTTADSLRRALRECVPTHAVCVFDGHERSWRHDRYPAYKEGRPPMPEALDAGMDRFKEAFSRLGVSSVHLPALEADDIIATLAQKVAQRGGSAVILSTDRLLLQLVSDLIIVRDHYQRMNLDGAYIREKLGVRPDQVADLFALAGYPTNNIPGVPQVGIKTAARLLGELDKLETVLAVAHTIKGKPGEMIYRYADQARLSQALVRLNDNLELGLNLRSFRYTRQPE